MHDAEIAALITRKVSHKKKLKYSRHWFHSVFSSGFWCVCVLTDDNNDRLGEKVLCCHSKITEQVDSRHVRLYLLEKNIISHDDYLKYFIPTDPCTEDRRSLCESMMYLLFKDQSKVNRNLQHFLYALSPRYSEDFVGHIGNNSYLFCFKFRPCFTLFAAASGHLTLRWFA